jgi:aryl-alcohol dehydrogenase-like predicted oxidoreductase
LTEENFDQLTALTTWAEKRGHTILDLAFAYLLSQNVVASVVAGATNTSQVQASAAAGTWRLADGEMDEVRSLLDR